jgi:UDP-glucose 4-epimerase
VDLWHALARVTGATHLSPEFLPPRSVNPVPRRLADIGRAERELGFRATTSLDEGLQRLIAWRKETLRVAEAA